MHISIISIFLIVVISCLSWWVAHKFTMPPMILTIVEIIIVVIAVLALLSSMGILSTGISIS